VRLILRFVTKSQRGTYVFPLGHAWGQPWAQFQERTPHSSYVGRDRASHHLFPCVSRTVLVFAVDGSNLFVSSGMNSSSTGFTGNVSLYDTSGSLVKDALITGLQWPTGLAVTPFPEPASLALLSLGTTALLLRRRSTQMTDHP
jgi:hypothetical protein